MPSAFVWVGGLGVKIPQTKGVCGWGSGEKFICIKINNKHGPAKNRTWVLSILMHSNIVKDTS